MNRHIIFVAYEFPPLNLGGVHRAISFTRYLPDYGIIPHVISLDPGSYKNVYREPSVDHGLLQSVGEQACLHRVPSDDILRDYDGFWGRLWNGYLSIVGLEAKGWEKGFYQAVKEIAKQFPVTAMLITAPPFSIIPQALRAAQELGIASILDLRDAWSNWFGAPYSTYFHYQALLWLERQCLTKATTVITTSRQTASDLLNFHRCLDKRRFFYLPNGYDGRVVLQQELSAPSSVACRFRIGYAGSFYYAPEAQDKLDSPWYKGAPWRMLRYAPSRQDWKYRSPYFFFRALEELTRRYPELVTNLQVHFIGVEPPWLERMIEGFGLCDHVTRHGYQSHSRTRELLATCDALLLTSAKVHGGADYSVAGKTFEYFVLGKPILGFVCEGEQKRILEESGVALICDPDSPGSAVDSMVRFLRGQVRLVPNRAFLRSFERSALVHRLSKCIERVGDCIL